MKKLLVLFLLAAIFLVPICTIIISASATPAETTTDCTHRKIIAYDAIEKKSIADLRKAIVKNLESGWQPFGGIAVIYGFRTDYSTFAQKYYIQAMVKYAQD